MGRKATDVLPYSDLAIRAAIKEQVAVGSGRVELRVEGVPGLVLIARHTGVGAWHYFYSSKAGLRRKPKIGEYPATSLATARERAEDWRKIVVAGGDPVGEAEATALGTTFRELMDMRLAVGDLRPATAAQYRGMLELDAGPIMGTPASEITPRTIVKLIDARLGKSGANRQADYFKTTLSSVFKFGISRRIVEVNPTIGLGKRDVYVPRETVLSMEEVTELWLGLSAEAPMTGGEYKKHARPPRDFNISETVRAALKLTLLTGQRRGEVAGAKVSELVGLDGDAPLWIIPGNSVARARTARKIFGRTKNGSTQTVPLSRQAAQLFRDALACRLDATSEYVFPADAGRVRIGGVTRSPHIDPKSMTRANERFWSSKGRADLHVHDLRRTMATWMGEAEIAGDVIRLALNHSATDVTGRVYNHAKLARPLRAAMQAWADHVSPGAATDAGAGDGAGAGNVVRLREVA